MSFVIEGNVLVKYIEDEGGTTAVIPDGVTEIADKAFCNCTAIHKIILPDSVKNIGFGAFWGCASLKSIRLPTYLPSIIQERTFGDCIELEEITIPNGVTGTSWKAFGGCYSLKRITFGKDIADLDPSTFYSMSAEQIIVDPENAHFSSEDGILYNKEKSILLRCPTGREGDVVIPDGVVQIGDDAKKLNALAQS